MTTRSLHYPSTTCDVKSVKSVCLVTGRSFCKVAISTHYNHVNTEDTHRSQTQEQKQTKQDQRSRTKEGREEEKKAKEAEIREEHCSKVKQMGKTGGGVT